MVYLFASGSERRSFVGSPGLRQDVAGEGCGERGECSLPLYERFRVHRNDRRSWSC